MLIPNDWFSSHLQRSVVDFDRDSRRKGYLEFKQSLNEYKSPEADFSTKSAYIITILGKIRTSAQAEPVDGICLDAKNRINGAIRCAI
ncbi:MAG: hypothetical protein OXC62_14305 [Aestuariivita sp.]|nr:hypothetical protein [Aestuariivita sp.]